MIRETASPSWIRHALALAASLLAAACGSVLPERGPPPDLYQIALSGAPAEASARGTAQLVVEEPVAARGLDTDRIAVRPAPHELKYLAGARWSDRAPRLVQALLIEALEETGGLAGVGRPSDGMRADYALVSELRAFEVDRAGSGTRVAVRLSAKLVREPAGQVAASRVFERVAESRSTSPARVVQAFNEAAEGVAREAAAWTQSVVSPQPALAIAP